MRDRTDLNAFDHSEAPEDPTIRSTAAEEVALEWEALEVTEEIAALPYSY